MTADVLSPNPKSLQPLKKRKVELNNTSNVDSSIRTAQEERSNTECATTNNNQNVQTENAVFNSRNNENNTNITGTDDDHLINDSQNSVISICKLEDLRFSPMENTESHEFIDVKDIKVENINSPDMFSPSTVGTNSMECRSKSQGTPPSCKKEKHYPNEDNTPSKRRKRKISNVGDYDQLSDILKSELYDNSLNDVEAIDMLHDLNSVIDFEETKIPSDFLSSTLNDNAQNDQNMELSKDPPVDPLFIANNDEHDKSTEDDNSNQINKTKTKLYLKGKKKLNDKTKVTNSTNKSFITSDVDNEDADETYNTINNVLGELNILSDTENEEGTMSEQAKKRLYDLEVQMIHQVPPQHKIEHTAGSKPLTKVEKQLFLSHGPIKKGVFSPNEDEIIKNNWKAFCEIHNWDPKNVDPFLCMKNGKQFYIRSMTERQKFVQFIANGLPWRTLYSVYHRFRNINGKYEKTFKRYTLMEDEKILLYMKNRRVNQRNQKHRFCDLAKMLGRTSHSVWLRYQLLKKMQDSHIGKPLSQVKWTLPLIGKFIKTIMDTTLSEKLEDIKDATLPKPVWLKIEEKLNIDHNVLKVLWMHQLHMQLFCPEPIYLNDIKIKLIEYIYGKGISHTREIIWPNVAKYFEGVTTVFLCKVFFYLVKESTTKIGTKDFPYIVDYLYTDKIRDIKNELTDKFLPRLSYSNGKVHIIDKDISDNIDTE
ncbi:uncharacterized protein LOC143154202 isoform X2 [Ptiloglossa arizonensis]|uniref:uncharacterized protein LOC143154202 isoform X2 n=1 Tax=Ptiloglossa arizonensis TaxID=3350558 RepID=UPI003FA07316